MAHLNCKNDEALRKAGVLACRFDTPKSSILGEVRNVEIPGPSQQLLCSKYHDFLAVFLLAHSKINQIS